MKSWSLRPLLSAGKRKKKGKQIYLEQTGGRRGGESAASSALREEAAKIHYLSVLYLSHMLLLSNLSLQILDSENKQRDQSRRSLQDAAVQRCPQAAGRKCRETPAGRPVG